MTIIRFGFVAMSLELEQASPSRTMTYASFSKLADREAAVARLEQIAATNLHNTLRLLKHCDAHHIKLYRFSSKLIPLATHAALEGWNPYLRLADHFQSIGQYVKEKQLRVSLHPDHFCVFSTPREEVLRNSIKDLEYHVTMLEAMGLDERSKCNIHMGGAYGDKPAAAERFIRQFGALPARLKQRVTLENDDKTFNVAETLAAAEAAGVPMVLDIHHYAVNDGGITERQLLDEYWPRIVATWTRERERLKLKEAQLPIKIHASSSKSASDPRGHADYVELEPLLRFLEQAKGHAQAIDCMLEAKAKDFAVFQLMKELKAAAAGNMPHIKILNDAAIEL